MRKLQFEATGTKWTVKHSGSLSKLSEKKILAEVRNFESFFSRFLEESIVSEMADAAGSYKLPEYSSKMLRLYEELESVSQGRFTPLVGSVLESAGYDKEYSLKPKQLAAVPRLKEVATLTGSTIEVKQPVKVDFGAAGKGLLIDRISELMRLDGARIFTINAGGDIYTTQTIGVGLENPILPGELVSKIEIDYGAVCASSGNRRDWGSFHHIIDAVDKRSPSGVIATWVYHKDSAMAADMFATALFLVEPQQLLSRYDFSCILVYSDGRVVKHGEFGGLDAKGN